MDIFKVYCLLCITEREKKCYSADVSHKDVLVVLLP